MRLARIAAITAVAIVIATGSLTVLETTAQATPVSVSQNIGDSYDAATGGDALAHELPDASAYVTTTRVKGVNECNRLKQPAFSIAASVKGYIVEDYGCAGATVEDILSKSQWNEGRQIDHIRSDVKLVNVQIGGNDAKFGSIVQCVLLQLDCTSGSDAFKQANQVLDNELPSKLRQLYRAIKQRAPNAKYTAAGYPPILPRTAADLGACVPYMSPGELNLTTRFMNKLNGVIQSAAQVEGFTYVDFAQADSPFYERDPIGLGTDACSFSAASSAWNIRIINPDGLGGILTFSFHPNKAGVRRQAIVYQAVIPATA